jgi:hypothetical protein
MRRAIVEVTPEFLPELGLLLDHGLEAVFSMASAPGVIAIVFEGDQLPAECEVVGGSALKVIEVQVREERYGRQRLNRIVKIHATERNALDIQARALRAA